MWFSELVEWLWPEDPSVPPRVEALDGFPAAQAAYLEYLNTPLVWTSIDRTEIEKQLSIFLEALNEADRPARWFDSFAPAYAYVRDKCLEDIVRRAGAVIGDDGALEAGVLGTPDSDGNGDADWAAAYEAAWRAAAGDLPARVRDRWEHIKYTCEEAREMAQAAACSAAARSREQRDWSRARQAALSLATETADEACETAWSPARWSVAFEHGAARKRGSAQGAAGRRAYAALRRAFAAGLWIFWVREANVIAVPAPNLYTDDQGRLHRTGGPAVQWPGEIYWFVDGEPAATGEISEERQEVVAAPASDLHTNSREDFSRRRESPAERPDETHWFADDLQAAREIVEAPRAPSTRESPHIVLRVGAVALALAALGLNAYALSSYTGRISYAAIASFFIFALGLQRHDLDTLWRLSAFAALLAMAEIAWVSIRSGGLPVGEIAALSISFAALQFLSMIGAIVFGTRAASDGSANAFPAKETQVAAIRLVERPEYEDRTSVIDMVFGALINGLLVLYSVCRGLVRFLLKALIGPFVKRSR